MHPFLSLKVKLEFDVTDPDAGAICAPDAESFPAKGDNRQRSIGPLASSASPKRVGASGNEPGYPTPEFGTAWRSGHGKRYSNDGRVVTEIRNPIRPLQAMYRG